MSQLINSFQAAVMLEYHPQTIRDLARAGILPGVKRRQKWFFDPVKVQEWFDNGGKEKYGADNEIADL